ncbi:Uncharacterized protein Rs2_12300 [Raphanus sativus]|nr:Uncharacterized protein Rs2_12300 [Raphanus sativus]
MRPFASVICLRLLHHHCSFLRRTVKQRMVVLLESDMGVFMNHDHNTEGKFFVTFGSCGVITIVYCNLLPDHCRIGFIAFQVDSFRSLPSNDDLEGDYQDDMNLNVNTTNNVSLGGLNDSISESDWMDGSHPCSTQ